jgi:hypothetical protein
MKRPRHSFRLSSAPTERGAEMVQVVTAGQRREKTILLFKGSALPTPHQFYSEVPFSVNLRSKTQRKI